MQVYKSRKKLEKIRKRRGHKHILSIFLLFLFLIFFVFIGVILYNRYSYTKERADLNTYLKIVDDEVAIFIDDILYVEEDTNKKNKGYFYNNSVYFPLSFVKEKFNNRFYYAEDIKKVLYCLPTELKSFGEDDIYQGVNATPILIKDEPYILYNCVKDFTNIRIDVYTDDDYKRAYIYTKWDKEKYAYLKEKEAARWKGGNKSPIIADCIPNEEVKILDKMTKWCKVKTKTGYIGYVRNSKLYDETDIVPKSDYIEPIREENKIDEKVVLGFHQLFDITNSKSLSKILKNAKGMNVIAPTWFALKDNDGNIRTIASADYAKYCKNNGIKVWATFNNFDIKNIDTEKVLKSIVTRKKIIDKLIREIEVNSLDGINIDMENINKNTKEHYVEFIRELSIELTKRKVTLSVDTYVPYEYNNVYDIAEVANFADYVLVMCYDEHYAGSLEAGSVSSISFVKDGINLSLQKVNKDNLIAILPFYTRIWVTDKSGKLTSKTYSSSEAKSVMTLKNGEFVFDEKTCQNYAKVVDKAGNKYECWLEDEKSLSYKMAEVVNNDLAGVAVWKLGLENEDFFEILNYNKRLTATN